MVLEGTYKFGPQDLSPGATPTFAGLILSSALAVAYGGTGQSTVQAAIDALSAVSGATNEHVLTKDTASGNAIWKAAVGVGFVDRGDPAAYDLREGGGETDFSSVGDTANTWYEFDLNAIASVPTSAKAVVLQVSVQDGAANSRMQFRDAGNSNNYNRSRIGTQAIDVLTNNDLIVSVTDAKIDIRTITIKFSDFTSINLIVKGWWL